MTGLEKIRTLELSPLGKKSLLTNACRIVDKLTRQLAVNSTLNTARRTQKMWLQETGNRHTNALSFQVRLIEQILKGAKTCAEKSLQNKSLFNQGISLTHLFSCVSIGYFSKVGFQQKQVLLVNI